MSRTLHLAAALCVLMATACSGSGGADDTTGRSADADPSLDLSTATLGEPVFFPVGGDVVLPPTETQLRWIELPDDEICVATVVGADLTRACVEWRSSVDRESFAWSADGTTLYFTPDFRRRFEEPDIWSFDPSTRSLTNETDDGSDEPFDDRAVLDIAPFTTEAGLLHFFTVGRRPSDVELSAIGEDGTVRSLPGVPLLESQPAGPLYPVGSDRYVYQGFGDFRPPVTLVLLDLRAGKTTEIALPLFEAPVVVGAGRGGAVVADLDALNRFDDLTFEFVNIDDVSGEAERQRLDLDRPEWRTVPAFGFSPDGSQLLAAVTSVDPAGGVELVGMQRTERGELGAPIPVGGPGFLGMDQSGDSRFPRTIGTFARIVWTENDRLLIPVGDGILVFELSAAE